jgi:hypothetical protein
MNGCIFYVLSAGKRQKTELSGKRRAKIEDRRKERLLSERAEMIALLCRRRLND